MTFLESLGLYLLESMMKILLLVTGPREMDSSLHAHVFLSRK